MIGKAGLAGKVRPAGMLAGVAMAAGIFLAACSDPANDVAKFDDAKLERLASAGDKSAIAERARRSDKTDRDAAEAKAKADIAQADKDAKANAEGRKAFEAALAAHDEARIEQLAADGNPAAMFHRGEARLKSDDQGIHQLGFDDIEYAADKGDPGALLWVGFRRSQGVEGYPWNPATGRDMVERAANMGSVDAMYAAGQIYDYAGPLHDVEKARAWYQKAADKGSDAARSRLEVMKAQAAQPEDNGK